MFNKPALIKNHGQYDIKVIEHVNLLIVRYTNTVYK